MLIYLLFIVVSLIKTLVLKIHKYVKLTLLIIYSFDNTLIISCSVVVHSWYYILISHFICCFRVVYKVSV